MIYYVFNSEAAAAETEQQIVDNVRQWVAANVPDALSADGTKLRGRNAATGALVDVFTERWAIPQETATGQWVFPKPTGAQTAPIPLDVFIANVVAAESEYDPTWFEQLG